MGVATGLLFMAVVALSHAATEPQKKGKGEQKSAGQQFCPPVVAKEQSQAQRLPVTASGKTTNVCPPVNCPPEKKQK